jgi:heat shock protein HslJ
VPTIAFPRRLVATASAAGLALLLTTTVLAQEATTPEVEASPNPPTAEASASPQPVLLEARPEGTWEVRAFDAWAGGLVEPRQSSTYTTTFLPGGRLVGETGCGSYFGGYSVDADDISMRVISKGSDPCNVKRTEEAVAYSVALEAVATWRPTASGLEFLDETGAVRLVLGRASVADLVGSWLVERYAKPNRKLVEPLSDNSLELVFDADGGVSGSAGCRFLEGLYESESDRVVIAPIETAGLPCEGDERRQERQFLRAIDDVVLWARDGQSLVLSDGFGEPLVKLTAAPPAVESTAVPDPLETAAPTGQAG